MSLMKNANDIVVPFARGIKKTEFNFIEDIFDSFFYIVGTIVDSIIEAINKVTEVLNDVIDFLNDLIDALDKININPFGNNRIPQIPAIPLTNLATFISRRKDMLMMETDYVNVPKLIMVKRRDKAVDNILTSKNETNINASFLYENYHYFSNFVPTKGWHNQKKIYDVENIPFTFDDYEKMRGNSNFYDSDGNECVALEIKWNPTKQVASLTYFIRYLYLNNINLTTFISIY